MSPVLVSGSSLGDSAGPAAAAVPAQVGVQREAGGPCIHLTARVVSNKPSLNQP